VSPHRLIFATRNRGKLTELRELLGDLDIEVLSLDDAARELPDVVEDGETFAANATKKAREISQATGLPALADDSGLEVDALGGAPGVHSARYSGVDARGAARDAANIDKLLAALSEVPEDRRTARFRAALALSDRRGTLGAEVIVTEGACEGRILQGRRGTGGFGYDPVFLVPSLGQTFAELASDQKNELSHRGRAMRAMKPRIAAYFRVAKPGGSR